MSTIDFKVDLWERLREIKPCYPHGTDQLSIRCPFCGDSVKSLSSAHLYIKIDMKSDIPVLFMCQRCDTSGILTPSVLRTLDVNDLNLNSALLTYNRAALKNMPVHLGMTNNEFNFKVPVADMNDERNIFKKEYFEKRLGVKTTFEELADLKVIFKLGQFLEFNEIETMTVGKEKAISLHNDYMGFLTAKNEFINFRQVYDSKFKRYEKYSVLKNLDNTRKFYTIPNEIDLLTTKRITLNIAEGPFDIAGIFYNVFDKERHNMIYTAVCGAGYVSVIKYFIKMGVIDNVDVNIFSDDDRGPGFYKKMVKELSPWVNEFNLFYNEKSKDFGVPKKDIKIVKKRI